jgi:hypothetical protein
MSISGQLSLSITCNQTSSTGQFAAISQTRGGVAIFKTQFSTDGTAGLADQIDLIYVNRISLLASTPQDVDVRTLVDEFGNAQTWARARAIAIRALTTVNGQAVAIKPGASNGWTAFLNSAGILTLPASTAPVSPRDEVNSAAFFSITAPNTTGLAITNTNKILTLDPGGAAIAVDVALFGCSA